MSDSNYFHVRFVNTSFDCKCLFGNTKRKKFIKENKKSFLRLTSLLENEFLSNERKKNSCLINNIARRIQRKIENDRVTKLEVELNLYLASEFFCLLGENEF